MADSIVNKVASSPLVTVDLEDYKTTGTRTAIDMANWLEEGFILREKPFRALLKEHDWTQYTDHHIALHCSSDAILPAWATLLITAYLSPFATTIVLGSVKDLEKELFSTAINDLDLGPYQDKPIMIKGCSDPSVPEGAYIQLVQRLQTVAKSMFYGEACSSVPLWKAKK
jgi:hypothetical protein